MRFSLLTSLLVVVRLCVLFAEEDVGIESSLELTFSGGQELVAQGKEIYEKYISRLRDSEPEEEQSDMTTCWQGMMLRLQQTQCSSLSGNFRSLLTFHALHCYYQDGADRDLVPQECWDENEYAAHPNRRELVMSCRQRLDKLSQQDFLMWFNHLHQLCVFTAERSYRHRMADLMGGMTKTLEHSAEFVAQLHAQNAQLGAAQIEQQKELLSVAAKRTEIMKENSDALVAQYAGAIEDQRTFREDLVNSHKQELGQVADELSRVREAASYLMSGMERIEKAVDRGDYFYFVVASHLMALLLYWIFRANSGIILTVMFYLNFCEPLAQFYFQSYFSGGGTDFVSLASRSPSPATQGDYLVFLLSSYVTPSMFGWIMRGTCIALLLMHLIKAAIQRSKLCSVLEDQRVFIAETLANQNEDDYMAHHGQVPDMVPGIDDIAPDVGYVHACVGYAHAIVDGKDCIIDNVTHQVVQSTPIMTRARAKALEEAKNKTRITRKTTSSSETCRASRRRVITAEPKVQSSPPSSISSEHYYGQEYCDEGNRNEDEWSSHAVAEEEQGDDVSTSTRSSIKKSV